MILSVVSKLISKKIRAAVGKAYEFVSCSLFVTDVFRVNLSDFKNKLHRGINSSSYWWIVFVYCESIIVKMRTRDH